MALNRSLGRGIRTREARVTAGARTLWQYRGPLERLGELEILPSMEETLHRGLRDSLKGRLCNSSKSYA